MGVRASGTTPAGGSASLRIEGVAALFAALFELDSVGPNDDFFRLGGESLLADELMAAVERRFGLVLSASVLVEAPTPAALAAVIGAADKRRDWPLFTVRETGKGPPLYCLHGSDGASPTAQRLATALGAGQPVYGLRAIGLEDGERPLVTVEAMARRYLAAIAAEAPPDGPCHLLGHCAGASVAYEMARQLLRRGQQVALVLIDPEIEERAPFLYQSRLDLLRRRLRLGRRARRLLRSLPATLTGDERRRAVRRAIDLATARYRPRPLACPTLFITSPERRVLLDPRRGYPRLLRNGRFVEVEATHKGLLMEQISRVAHLIGRFLARPDEPSTAGGTGNEPLRSAGASRSLPA